MGKDIQAGLVCYPTEITRINIHSNTAASFGP